MMCVHEQLHIPCGAREKGTGTSRKDLLKHNQFGYENGGRIARPNMPDLDVCALDGLHAHSKQEAIRSNSASSEIADDSSPDSNYVRTHDGKGAQTLPSIVSESSDSSVNDNLPPLPNSVMTYTPSFSDNKSNLDVDCGNANPKRSKVQLTTKTRRKYQYWGVPLSAGGRTRTRKRRSSSSLASQSPKQVKNDNSRTNANELTQVCPQYSGQNQTVKMELPQPVSCFSGKESLHDHTLASKVVCDTDPLSSGFALTMETTASNATIGIFNAAIGSPLGIDVCSPSSTDMCRSGSLAVRNDIGHSSELSNTGSIYQNSTTPSMTMNPMTPVLPSEILDNKQHHKMNGAVNLETCLCPYPSTWERCIKCESIGNAFDWLDDSICHNGTALIDDDDTIPCHVVEVLPHTSEFRNVAAQLLAAGFDVVKVDRIQNHFALEKYTKSCQDDIRKTGVFKERSLFHVTRADSLEDLFKEGLDQRLAARGRFGRGLYFAEDPRKSDSYWKGARYSNRVMLQLKVNLGRVKEYFPGQIDPNLRREPKGFDSVQGKIANQKEYVVYNSDRAVIEYAITYRRIGNVAPVNLATSNSLLFQAMSGSSSGHTTMSNYTSRTSRYSSPVSISPFPQNTTLTDQLNLLSKKIN